MIDISVISDTQRPWSFVQDLQMKFVDDDDDDDDDSVLYCSGRIP